jgi:hypothetical protein
MSWCPGYFHPEKCGPKKILNCFIGPPLRLSESLGSGLLSTVSWGAFKPDTKIYQGPADMRGRRLSRETTT